MLGAAVLFTLSGCWLQPGGGAGGTHHNDHEGRLTAANVASLAERWSVGYHDQVSEPVVDDAGRVVTAWLDGFPGSEARALEARSSATGEVLWTRSYAPEDGTGDNWIGQPSIIAGAVWLPYGYADRPCETLIRRYVPATGLQIPNAIGADGVVTTPVVGAHGVVAYGVRSCDPAEQTWELVVRADDDARLLWSVELPGSPQRASIDDGRLIVAAGGVLRAYPAAGCGAATCAPLWTYAPPASELWGRPMVVPGGPVVVEAMEQHGPGGPATWFQTTARVLAADTGAELWRSAVERPDTDSSVRSLATDGESVFVVNMPSVYDEASPRLESYPLAGCGAASCPPAWTAPIGEWTNEGTLLVGGDLVYLEVGAEVRAYPAGGCGGPTCAPQHVLPVVVPPATLALSDGHLFATFLTGNHTLPSLVAYGP